jgi:hypothetical protein
MNFPRIKFPVAFQPIFLERGKPFQFIPLWT